MNKLIDNFYKNEVLINKIKLKKSNKLLPIKLFNGMLILSIIQIILFFGIKSFTNEFGKTMSLFVVINTLLVCGVFFITSKKNIQQLHRWVESNVYNLTLLAFSVSISFIPILIHQMFFNFIGVSYAKHEVIILNELKERNKLIKSEILNNRSFIEHIILNKNKSKEFNFSYDKIVEPFLLNKYNNSNFTILDNKFLKNKKTIEVI